MKITTFKTSTHHLPLTKPYTIAFDTFSSVEIHLLTIEIDGKFRSFGAASPAPDVTNENPDKSFSFLSNEARDFFQGMDLTKAREKLFQLRENWGQLYPAAVAAIDMAFYDFMGKWLDKPLVDILGRRHGSLPTSVTLGIKDSLEESLTDAKEYKEQGFSILKVKTGRHLEHDIELVHKIKERFPHFTIRVDANQGYDLKDLITFVKKTKSLNIESIEQPFPKDKQYLLKEAPQDQLFMVDEGLHFAKDALEIIQENLPYSIFNIKLMKCGGLTSAREIALLAHLSKKSLMWGCMDESRVSIAAALHEALSSPATRYLDLDGHLDLASDLVTGGFEIKNGMMNVTAKSGLGVDLID